MKRETETAVVNTLEKTLKGLLAAGLKTALQDEGSAEDLKEKMSIAMKEREDAPLHH